MILSNFPEASPASIKLIIISGISFSYFRQSDKLLPLCICSLDLIRTSLIFLLLDCSIHISKHLIIGVPEPNTKANCLQNIDKSFVVILLKSSIFKALLSTNSSTDTG
ncbi:hypothetical protein D3C76_753750 [compost metagenome]